MPYWRILILSIDSWLIGTLTHRRIDSLTHCTQLTHLSIGKLTHWRIDSLTHSTSTVIALTHPRIDWIFWQTDALANWLIDALYNWRIDASTQWRIGKLTQGFILRSCIPRGGQTTSPAENQYGTERTGKGRYFLSTRKA